MADTTIVLRYVFPSTPPPGAETNIVRSNEAIPRWLTGANPGGWHPVEWSELLDGTLGPWAMVVAEQRVLSIAHTPKPMTDVEAECGVWTDPIARGKGFAAAAASAWASILRSTDRRLVYSTTEGNLSSQRVAERLKLKLISRHEMPRKTGGSNVHPLCSVRGDGV